MPWISEARWQYLERSIVAIHRRLGIIERMELREMANISDIRTQVAAQTEVIASVETLLGTLKTKLDEAIASGDPAKLQEVSDMLAANTTRLAQDVVANTPAA